MQDAYYRCAQAGVSLMIAAGNDMNSAVGNRYGNGLPLAESPDSALVSTPSTSFAAMSVASVENFKNEVQLHEAGSDGKSCSKMAWITIPARLCMRRR